VGERNYMIHEKDLCELERLLPMLAEDLTPVLNPRIKTQLRRVKQILSDVRWDYGPPEEVLQIPAEN
jgi:hypothetical protein